jgi:CrcB protein
VIRNFLFIGLGGALGSMSRYGIDLLIGAKSFPLSTLLINITGSFIIGLVIAVSLKNESFSNNWKLFLATGLCGGFTTFSAFSVENLLMFQNGKFVEAVLYILCSILSGIAAVWSGFKLITLVTA